ncbi:hypothetical protein [Nonomuraea sp. NPDC049129]|uniref:hypothetical protein n=1 Tax=Nonomuraea sp. NPDC049129 TaxID=3155272 RepID=UPI003408C352
MTAAARAVAILALQGCSRVVDGHPCEVCLFRAAKDVAAVERGGHLVIGSAEDLQAWRERAENAEAVVALTRERLDTLIAAGFGAVTDTLRELRAALNDTGDAERG